MKERCSAIDSVSARSSGKLALRSIVDSPIDRKQRPSVRTLPG